MTGPQDWIDDVLEPGSFVRVDPEASPEVRAQQEAENGRWRQVYFILVERMKKEAVHVPMNTIQMLLIERIARNYIVLRLKETYPVGDPQGFAHATIQKDFNTFWLATTSHFNQLMAKTNPTDRTVLLGQIRDMLVGVVQGLDVPTETRNQMLARFADGFEELGVV